MTKEDKDLLARLIIEYGDKKSHIGAYIASGKSDTSFADMLVYKNQLLDKILHMVLEC